MGTLEEIFEIWTWAQLGIRVKPLGFLDVTGFWLPLMAFLDRAVDAGFLRSQHRAIAFVDRDPAGCGAVRRVRGPPRAEVARQRRVLIVRSSNGAVLSVLERGMAVFDRYDI